MGNTARKIIGRNVKALREALDLSQLKFAEMTDLSRATIINVESGKTGYNLNLIDKILAFTDYKIEDLSKENFIVRKDIRDELADKYRDFVEIHVILNKKPTIKYAVKHKLLPSKFLSSPKEINEITRFFKKFGWNFLGTSIQNELKAMPNIIDIQPHPTKGGTNLYTQKK